MIRHLRFWLEVFLFLITLIFFITWNSPRILLKKKKKKLKWQGIRSKVPKFIIFVLCLFVAYCTLQWSSFLRLCKKGGLKEILWTSGFQKIIIWYKLVMKSLPFVWKLYNSSYLNWLPRIIVIMKWKEVTQELTWNRKVW